MSDKGIFCSGMKGFLDSFHPFILFYRLREHESLLTIKLIFLKQSVLIQRAKKEVYAVRTESKEGSMGSRNREQRRECRVLGTKSKE